MIDSIPTSLARENMILEAKLAYRTAVNDTIDIITKSFGQERPGTFIDRETNAAEQRYLDKLNESEI